MKYIFILIPCFLAFAYSNSNAQNGYANNWYFGDGCAITFNNGTPPVAISPSAINTAEGCASISNAAGQLLFYTDGIKVWNKNSTQMPNGNGLLGDPSSTQSGVIAPDPGSPNRYYVFAVATSGFGGLTYSIVDMTLQGGLGDVTSTKNVPLVNPTGEKINAVQHANGHDIWILTHQWNSNAFYAYLLTAAGVSNPVITNVGTGLNGGYTYIGQLKSSPDGKHIAMSAEVGFFEMYDFDPATGILSNPVTDNALPADGTYGCEFSPSGNLVYISNNSPGQLFQYNLLAGSGTAILASRTLVGSYNSTIGSLQLAPDKKIYCATPGSSSLSEISNPDVIGSGCNFQTSTIHLLGTCQLGLPDFIATFFKASHSISSNGYCPGQTTNFTISGPAPDSVAWNFGDVASGTGDTSSLIAPQHKYSDTGSYSVNLVCWIADVSDTSTATVTILPNPTVNLGLDTTVPCKGTVTIDAGAGFTNYLWQDGTTTEIYNMTAAGTYSVTVTDNNGCMNWDTIKAINSSAPTVTLDNNSSLPCKGVITLDPGAGYTTYAWQDGATNEVYTVSQPGNYSVTITDKNGCANSGQCNRNQQPAAVRLPCTDTLMQCKGTLLLDAGAGYTSYVWQDGNPGEFYTVTQPGTYSVLVIDDKQCFNSAIINVTYESCNEVFIPDAFSPNGDGVNDRFGIINTQFIASGKMKVYNRWGQEIFETSAITDSWDGFFKGAPCQIGVYTYVLNATDTEGKHILMKGNLSLLR